MGCTSSAPALDAQAMLEKQREIMLQRQKEFEQKRAQQQQQQGTPNTVQTALQLQGKAPPPLSTTRVVGSKNGSAPPSPATPLKTVEPPKLPKLDGNRNSAKDVVEKPVTETATIPIKIEVHSAKSSQIEDPSYAQEVADRARRFTVDQNDINARRSKNVHDLAMYGKDVTRRPSFNPRPKESPFTPEMQAMMRAGHEAMMKEEAEKKTQRLLVEQVNTDKEIPTGAESIVKKSLPLPEFEDEDAEASKTSTAAEISKTDKIDSEEPKPAEQEKPKEKELEDFDLNVEEARRKAEEEKTKRESAPLSDDPNVAKYLAKDNADRKSKNVHDLGQYFSRRASFNPDAPGQRRLSFLPPPGGGGGGGNDAAGLPRRASYIPPPTGVT